jgi:hypothetical protein
MLPEDIHRWISVNFRESERDPAFACLAGAVDHTGAPAGERMLRCAAVGSRGNLESLKYLVSLLKLDYRDVIVAGEYDVVTGKLVRVRDLTAPIS